MKDLELERHAITVEELQKRGLDILVMQTPMEEQLNGISRHIQKGKKEKMHKIKFAIVCKPHLEMGGMRTICC